MKRVLYIEPFSSEGHLNFNRIYISKLLELNIKLDLVLKESYIQKIGVPLNLLKLKIPKYLFITNKGSFVNRIYFFKILSFIKKNIDLSVYDFVIMAGYEEISLFFSNIKQKLILINHSNISGLNSYVKRYFFKRISKNNHHIVFEEYMKEYLNEIGVKNAFVIAHGLPNPFRMTSEQIDENVKTILKDNFYKKFQKIIFSPSSGSVDRQFMEQIVRNHNFINFLENQNILLIIKGDFSYLETKNIKIVRDYLSEIQYRSLILLSNAILIKYPDSHMYRVSAVFFECIANDKLCFLSDIKALKCYEPHLNYNAYFSDTNQLISIITEWIRSRDKSNVSPYICKEALVPSFNEIFS